MTARKYATTDQIDALTAQVAALTAALAQATPVTPKPATGKAESPFVGFLRERAASKVACEIHDAAKCNRTFSPKSSGRNGHVARLG